MGLEIAVSANSLGIELPVRLGRLGGPDR
jgi:hypothetical protein